MEIEPIERQEQELMTLLNNLYNQPMSLEVSGRYEEVYSAYKQIHLDYA